jgi:hypothetical protein
MDQEPNNILVWNIRGASNARGKRRVKELVRSFKPTIFVIFETHCQFSVASSFWRGLGFEAACILEARGHSGGIWVLVLFTGMSQFVFLMSIPRLSHYL